MQVAAGNRRKRKAVSKARMCQFDYSVQQIVDETITVGCHLRIMAKERAHNDGRNEDILNIIGFLCWVGKKHVKGTLTLHRQDNVLTGLVRIVDGLDEEFINKSVGWDGVFAWSIAFCDDSIESINCLADIIPIRWILIVASLRPRLPTPQGDATPRECSVDDLPEQLGGPSEPGLVRQFAAGGRGESLAAVAGNSDVARVSCRSKLAFSFLKARRMYAVITVAGGSRRGHHSVIHKKRYADTAKYRPFSQKAIKTSGRCRRAENPRTTVAEAAYWIIVTT